MDYIDISEISMDTGFGIYNCPVGIDVQVWNECVKWTDEDNEIQDYQEEDARLWDILFVGGAKVQMNPNEILVKDFVPFEILCIPRDGVSTEAKQTKFKIEKAILKGIPGLAIRYLNT